MRYLPLITLLAATAALPACAHRRPYATVEDGLDLSTVVLYRNGVGYFERVGKLDGDMLTIKVRKDQVNDLLKSLTVIDDQGQALSVSMPLDPQSWANAALATLQPGRGSLAEVLDALRGTPVTVRASGRSVTGRIVMVEELFNEPAELPNLRHQVVLPPPAADTHDHKLTLLDGDRFEVVKLSQVRSLVLRDGDLAMQLNRRLDASAGEGMFEQVAVSVRLSAPTGGRAARKVHVSYVVSAPMWKPTYRVVLPEGGKGQALLQGWAVIDNVSGEDWSEVALSVTSGAPISFQYDLHTPREVYRADLTEAGVRRQVRVSVGETTFDEEALAEELAAAELEADDASFADEDGEHYGVGTRREQLKANKKAAPTRSARSTSSRSSGSGGLGLSGTGRGGGGTGSGSIGLGKVGGAPGARGAAPAAEPSAADGPSIDLDALRRSTQASARAQQVSGLTRIDLPAPVTVPDGSSTMVAVINEQVEAEETFLYRPGGAGMGYERNPYRVVRFRNSTPYVLEPGPISIYAGGSFVGEGLSESVGAKTSVTIPFAVEPSIVVEQRVQHAGQEMQLTRIVRGVLEVESFNQTRTTWSARRSEAAGEARVLVRHPRSGPDYQLSERPEGTEELDGAYLVPVTLAQGKASGEVTLVEQTPSKTSFSIFDQRAPDLLDKLIAAGSVDAETRKRLEGIVAKRREIGKVDTLVDGLRRQQVELDQRARETRSNLEAIKKDPRAGNLRQKLNQRLDEFTREGDKIGREIVELNSRRLELKIELDDALENFELRVPRKDPKAAGTTPGKQPVAPKK